MPLPVPAPVPDGNPIREKTAGTGLRRDTAKAVLRLAWPAAAQSLLHTCVFLVDRAMLGHHGPDSLASMQISGPVTWSLYSIVSAFAVGSMAFVGRAIGAGDRDAARAGARASLLLALGLGCATAIAGTLLIEPILSAFPSAGPAVQSAARGYLGVMLPSIPLILVAIAASAVLQAAGDTRTPFLVAAAANAVNVLLGYAFIFGRLGAPELGARGAALAGAVAIGLEACVLTLVLLRTSSAVSVRGRGGTRDAGRRVLRVSGPALAERMVSHAGFLGYVAMIGALGPLAMAANQALISIESICFLSADGFGVAAAAIVAQRLGARRPDEAAFGGWVAVGMTVALLSGCGLLFVTVPHLLLGPFTDDPAIVAAGVPCLLVAAIAQPFMAVSIVLAQALRGAGDTRTPLLVTFVGGLALRLAATWLFAFGLDLGLAGVWWGSTADWVVRAVLLTAAFLRGRWRAAEV